MILEVGQRVRVKEEAPKAFYENPSMKEHRLNGDIGVVVYCTDERCEVDFGDSLEWVYNPFELQVVNANKDDLVLNRIVKFRDNRYGIVSKLESGLNVIVILETGSYVGIDTLDENLIRCEPFYSHDFDIMEIYKLNYFGDFIRALKNGTDIGLVDKTTIWKRENGKETELNKLITKLETQLEDAKEELKNIKEGE